MNSDCGKATFNKKAAGRELYRRTFNEMPVPQLKQNTQPLSIDFD